MKIPSFMAVDYEPITLNFKALEVSCKLSFSEDQRKRLTSAAEAYRAWSKATRCSRNKDKDGLLSPDRELRKHLKEIAKTAAKLAKLLNVDLATHPREHEVVGRLWDAIGLEEPNIDPRKGLSIPLPPNPEIKFYRPRNLAVILEMYAQGAKAFEVLMPQSEGGRPDDWNLAHYIKVLRTIFKEAGGGDGILCYKSEASGRCQGAFFNFVCEWCSKALGLPLNKCKNPVWLAIQKEQAEKKQAEKQTDQ